MLISRITSICTLDRVCKFDLARHCFKSLMNLMGKALQAGPNTRFALVGPKLN